MLEFESALARAAAVAGVIPRPAARAISEAALRGGFDTAAIARGGPRRRHAGDSAGQGSARARSPRSIRRVPPTCTGEPPARTSPTRRWCCSLEQARVRHRRRSRAARSRPARAVGTARGDGDARTDAAAAGHADHIRSQGCRVDGGNHAELAASARRVGTSAGHPAWAAPPARWPRSTIRAFAIADARPRASLGLRVAPPWHTNRDRLGALVTACGLFVAALGKVARDITLLMQAEVGEAAEPGGGSSTMPHKQNPSGCALVLAAATRMPVARRGVPDRDDSGTRTRRRRQPGRVADRRRGRAGDRRGRERAGRCGRGTDRRSGENAAEPRSHRWHHLRRAGGDAAGAGAGRDRTPSSWWPQPSRRAAGVVCPFAAALLAAIAADEVPADLLHDIDRPERYLGAAETLRTRLLNDAGRVDHALCRH